MTEHQLQRLVDQKLISFESGITDEGDPYAALWVNKYILAYHDDEEGDFTDITAGYLRNRGLSHLLKDDVRIDDDDEISLSNLDDAVADHIYSLFWETEKQHKKDLIKEQVKSDMVKYETDTWLWVSPRGFGNEFEVYPILEGESIDDYLPDDGWINAKVFTKQETEEHLIYARTDQNMFVKEPQ